MTTPATPPIPQTLAERFAKAFAAFVDAVRAAVQENITNPPIANTSSFLAWQTGALPRLEQQNAEVQNAWARYLIGEERTIATLAAGARGLAKQLDGYALEFAGPERAQLLDKLETAVVVAASQLCTAARIP
jgi:hypothetical protein